MRPAYAGAVMLVTLAWACVLVAIVLQVGYGVPAGDPQTGLTDVVLAIAWPALALLVLRQQPGNRLLWVFLAIGAGMGIYLAGTDLSVLLARNGRPGDRFAEWLGVGFGEFAWPLLWLVIQLFPTGRPLPGRFWRWAFVFSLLWYGANSLQVLLTPDTRESFRHGNPYASGRLAELFGTLFRPLNELNEMVGTSPGFLAILLLGLVSFGLRYRRGSALERTQLRVLGVGLLVVVAAIAVISLVPGDSQAPLIAVVFLLLPVSFGVAILRPRLYDLDRLVSRTATYALLAGLLAGVYAGDVALTTHLLSFSSSLSAALATLVAVALFTPLRHVLQAALERRFNRSGYDAMAQVEDFAVRLRTPVSTEMITDDLLAVVGRTVRPASASVWLTEAPR